MKFIVVRYAPGASGKFISTLLQLSPDINPWYAQIHTDQVVNWFQSKFSKDFVNWLKQEPEVPYQTTFVSNRFDRGNKIDITTALSLLHDDELFQSHWDNDKKICLILNKSAVPAWVQNNCHLVNIVIDGPVSKIWVNRCRLHKQFLRHDQNTWIIKQDHPDFCNQSRAKLAQQFNNETLFSGTSRAFFKKYIISDPLTNLFTDPDKIVQDPTNLGQSQIFLNLSSVICPENIVDALLIIYEKLQVQPPDPKLIQQLAEHYWHTHKSIIPQRQ